jgi:hypothetical protein
MAPYLAALLLLATQAIPQPPSTATGMIVGQVIDAGSGRPAAGALVTISGPPTRQSGPAAIPTPRILTGSDGRFVFRGLPGGSYSITASKPGYADGAYGRTRPGGGASALTLSEAERNGDVPLRIWKNGAISGTVVDEAGEPQIRVGVRAYRRTLAAGRPRFIPAAGTVTDDRGMYRIPGLLPGDYIVATSARYASVPLSALSALSIQSGSMNAQMAMELGLLGGSQSGTPNGYLTINDGAVVMAPGTPTPPAPAGTRTVVYPQVFHPTPPGGDRSVMIKLRPGEEHLSADLQIVPVPVVRVSGTVIGPEGPVARAPLRLVASTGGEVLLESEPPTTITDLDGSFTFAAVPSGTYNLRLFRPVAAQPGGTASLLWINYGITVGDGNIDNLTLSPSPGLTVTGRVEFEGNAPRPSSPVQILIENADAVTGGQPQMARSSADGGFSSPPLAPGRYYVRVANSPPGWMFKSATVGGRDAADIPVALEGTTAEAVVTFTDRWSGLKGTVQNTVGGNAGSVVIVFPADEEAWTSSGQNPRRLRSTRTNKAGEYSLNLPPGDYYAAAIPEDLSADWQDPEFLEAVSSSATRVRIAEGERPTQALRVLEIK